MGMDKAKPADRRHLTLERRVELLEERVRIEDRLWWDVGEAKSRIHSYRPSPKKVEVVTTLDDAPQDTG